MAIIIEEEILNLRKGTWKDCQIGGGPEYYSQNFETT